MDRSSRDLWVFVVDLIAEMQIVASYDVNGRVEEYSLDFSNYDQFVSF